VGPQIIGQRLDRLGITSLGDEQHRAAHGVGRQRDVVRISVNVTGDFGNVTDFDRELGCAKKIVVMGWLWLV
jgi:hypothetical protein